MVAVRISPFGGMIPAVDNRLLPDINASFSRDTWTYSGTAVGLPVPKLLRALTDPTATKVFRIPNNYTDADHMADAFFMEFGDVNTDVIRGLVVGDTFDRYYWASSSIAPKMNTKARILAGSAPFFLGIPSPASQTAVPTGGSSGIFVSRAYVTTFVSAYGEEGPVSPPTFILSMRTDAAVNMTFPSPATADLGIDRNLTRRRVYRTITGTDGTTTYFRVVDLPIGTTTYSDSTPDLQLASNPELQSTSWSAPPSDLQGMTAMSNGIIAGFRGNEIWFSEPYRPHAWPAAYVLTTEYNIVGLGAVGQTLVVCTEGYPYTVTGINPAAMVPTKLTSMLPCTSRGSIVSTVDGVYFSTPQGLALAAGNDAIVVTRELIRRDRWNALIPMTTLRAAILGNAYYGFGAKVLGVFDPGAFDIGAFAQEDNSGSNQGVLLDPTSKQVAFNVASSEISVTNVMADSWTGEVLLIKNGNLYWLDIGDLAQPRVPFLWTSKIFQTDTPQNFQVAKIYFSKPAGLPTLNPVPNATRDQALKDDQWGLLRAYTVDNDTTQTTRRLVFTREIRTSGEQIRLPSGFKANFWQFEIETRLEILSAHFATGAKELRKV